MKKILLVMLAFLSLVLYGCSDSSSENITTNTKPNSNNKEENVKHSQKLINVKYRESLVDVNNGSFEDIDTSRSSFIREAYYDIENQYMIVKLKEAYYHYCDLPPRIWQSFKESESLGTYYNKSIKGNFSCVNTAPPSY